MSATQTLVAPDLSGAAVGPTSESDIPDVMFIGRRALEEGYHVARERVITEFESRYLNWLVLRSGGNMSKAARMAGVDRTTLYRVMERLGLPRGPRSPRSSDPSARAEGESAVGDPPATAATKDGDLGTAAA